MIPDIDHLLPHWAEHLIILGSALNLIITGLCSWLSTRLLPPNGIHSNGYRIFYAQVQRISWAGRKPWGDQATPPAHPASNEEGK